MVTREQLRNFRRSKRELKTILALMRQAELRVSADTTRQRDRERALAEAARYEKAADHWQPNKNGSRQPSKPWTSQICDVCCIVGTSWAGVVPKLPVIWKSRSVPCAGSRQKQFGCWKRAEGSKQNRRGTLFPLRGSMVL